MDEREERIVVEETPPRVERETTVVTGDGGGGGGLIAAVVLLLVVAVLAFLFFSGTFNRAADEVGVNVNVETPEVKLPDIDVNVPPPASQPSEPAENKN